MNAPRLAMATVSSVLALAACDVENRAIRFVVPDGFTGAIILAQVDGYDFGYERIDGVYRYVIPESGVLCVADYQVFQTSFRLSAQYAGGGKITSALDGVTPPPAAQVVRVEAIGQRGFSSHKDSMPEPERWPMEAWFAVGTQAQVEEVARDMSSADSGFDVGRCQRRN